MGPTGEELPLDQVAPKQNLGQPHSFCLGCPDPQLQLVTDEIRPRQRMTEQWDSSPRSSEEIRLILNKRSVFCSLLPKPVDLLSTLQELSSNTLCSCLLLPHPFQSNCFTSGCDPFPIPALLLLQPYLPTTSCLASQPVPFFTTDLTLISAQSLGIL